MPSTFIDTHCHLTDEPLYDRLKHFSQVTGVLHAFNGGPEFAEKFLELGYYLAFGGGVSFSPALFLSRGFSA
jgi:TatD DNase family protein